MSFASVFRKIFYKSKKSRFTTRFPAWCRSQNCMPKILRMVAEAGFEPAVFWLWAKRDSGFLYSAIKTSRGTHCKEACEVLLKSFSVAILNRGFTIVYVGNYSTLIIANCCGFFYSLSVYARCERQHALLFRGKLFKTRFVCLNGARHNNLTPNRSSCLDKCRLVRTISNSAFSSFFPEAWKYARHNGRQCW